MRRVFTNSRWSAEQVLVKNARENFTVSWDGNLLYIFGQDSEGDILLTTLSLTDDTWSSRVALKNQFSKIHQIVLHPIIKESAFTILYNASNAEDKSHSIVMRSLTADGKWSPAVSLDPFLPAGISHYEVQQVSGDHLILFYQKRSPDYCLGYREITPEAQSDYHVFYSTHYFVSDTAYLTTNEAIHTLFVVKSMFSSQLIYRKKDVSEFSNPIVLYEAQRIEKCLMCYVKGILHVFFHAAGQLFECVSDNQGASFSRSARYKKKFCQNPEKAYYISLEPQFEDSLFARQVFVDHQSPWDVQILPDLYDDFYPDPAASAPIATMPADTETLEELERLRNQISILQRHNSEKDKQIVQLTQMMSHKYEEPKLSENRDEQLSQP